MKSFTVLKGTAAPMDRANVDTDLIIPKQFLKSIQRSGFGPYLFDEVRYLDQGEPGQDCSNRPLNPDFPLNQPHYQNSSVLLTRENFGCGSSREHAPWALEDFGIYCIIAPSFADIFYNNCFKNGILPVELDAAVVDRLFAELYASEGYSEAYELTVDLSSQSIQTPFGETIHFEVDEFRKHCLLNGLDDIALTLESADAIHAYEKNWRKQSPWLFDVIR
jgi:3-isopropylmalate/(R)-2-methylmalate dehydratase small subunit